ncbi:MAG TPA: hypothetical protein VFE40_12580 [Jatrophihabitantaceae bacterium]|jgi:hypothetical protein|nr:hypothetical protein [Jatrophihabitantaceae bacterium]
MRAGLRGVQARDLRDAVLFEDAFASRGDGFGRDAVGVRTTLCRVALRCADRLPERSWPA